MAVRLLTGFFVKQDGEAMEDFEFLPIGPITSLPQIAGNAGCVLKTGVFYPRQGG